MISCIEFQIDFSMCVGVCVWLSVCLIMFEKVGKIRLMKRELERNLTEKGIGNRFFFFLVQLLQQVFQLNT